MRVGPRAHRELVEAIAAGDVDRLRGIIEWHNCAARADRAFKVTRAMIEWLPARPAGRGG